MQTATVTPKKAMESLMIMVMHYYLCYCLCYFVVVYTTVLLFTLQIGELYGNDVHQLELCLDYWPVSSSGEVSIMRGPHYNRVPHKQVCKVVHIL